MNTRFEKLKNIKSIHFTNVIMYSKYIRLNIYHTKKLSDIINKRERI